MIQNIANTNNILSVLDDYISSHNSDEIALGLARNFRKRRVEKDLTREQIAEKAGISVSNVTRFEQKGLISLKNLIELAIALGYTPEIKGIFSEPKYTTMEELTEIRANANKKRARRK